MAGLSCTTFACGDCARGLLRCLPRGKAKPVVQKSKPHIGVIGDFIVDIQAKIPSLPQWDTDVETPGVDVLPGGSASNTARQLAVLARNVTLFCTYSSDLLGSAAMTVLRRQGFDTSQMRMLNLPSSVCLVLSGPSDRAFVTSYSTVEALTASEINEAVLQSCSHVHVGGYFGLRGLQTERFTAMLRECRRLGATVSLATQCDPKDCWTGTDNHLLQLLPLLDVFLANETEYASVERALARPLYDLAPSATFVVTQGKRGAAVRLPGASSKNVPALTKNTFVVDACGAGDAFTAGFLSRWVINQDAFDAAAWGNAVASCNVMHEGACAEPILEAEVHKAFDGPSYEMQRGFFHSP